MLILTTTKTIPKINSSFYYKNKKHTHTHTYMATYVVDKENKKKQTIPNPQRQKNEHHLLCFIQKQNLE
jgi:hypothetical protein